MTAPGQPWPLNFKVISCCFHVVAIGSGIFRLVYRWHISRFGCEDTWALLALLTDIGCLVGLWLQQSAPTHLTKTDIIVNYLLTVTVTSVPWEARLSMISTIIRITKPCESIRRMSYAAAVSFYLMWAALLAQKLYICSANSCEMTDDVAISQLTTDVISDTILIVMPIFFLKGIKISRSQRLLLVSSFASSICITIISIGNSIYIFTPLSSKSLLFAYIKSALAVLICNLLVIVTFAYRYFRKIDVDSGGTPTASEPIQFTTFIPGQLTLRSHCCPTPLPRTSIHFVPSSCAKAEEAQHPCELIHDPSVD